MTQRALCAVRSFLSAGLLTLDPAREPAAIASVVHAATSCRFELTDPAADEVVLICILQLLVTCVQCPSGGKLSDEAVCEVVHSCFRIFSQASLSDLLRYEAEAGLRAMVQTLFQRIPHIAAADPPPPPRRRRAGCRRRRRGAHAVGGAAGRGAAAAAKAQARAGRRRR